MTRIVSLDNEPGQLQLYSLIFEFAGYDHSATFSDDEALSLLKSDPPDLFTQDVFRPGAHGVDFYQRMKEDATLREIPVLFITARPPSEFFDECRARYGDEHLRKPFDRQTLLSTVADLLRRRGKHVPTEEERAARHDRVRSKLMSEMKWTEEQFDEIWKNMTDRLRETSQDAASDPPAPRL